MFSNHTTHLSDRPMWGIMFPKTPQNQVKNPCLCSRTPLVWSPTDTVGPTVVLGHRYHRRGVWMDIATVEIPGWYRRGETYTVKVAPQHLWLFKAWKWRVNRYGYVVRRTSVRIEGRIVGRDVFLHREIAGTPYGDPRQPDHLDGDPLNNHYLNLEIVSKSENIARRNRNVVR